MAGREEFRADFLVGKNEITEEAEEASRALDKLDGEAVTVDLDADVSQVLGALDQVAAEAKRTEAAAEALSQALGPELTAKADPTAIVGDLREMGLSIEQITTNADQLGTKLRELSDADVGGKLGANLGTTRGQMDQLRNSSDQTRSVMANLAGNTAQDLGELGGAAGTAGVAIGQLAEYAVDGNVSLASLAKLAGPMLAVGAAATIISTAISGIKAEEAFRADLVKKFTEAMREGETVASSLHDTLSETGELEFQALNEGFLGLGTETKNLVPLLDKAKLSLADFEKIVAQTQTGALAEGWTRVRDAVEQAGLGAQLSDEDWIDLGAAVDQYAESASGAISGSEALNRVLTVTGDAAAQAFDAFMKAEDPISRYPEEFARIGQAISQGVTPSAKDLEVVTEGLGISMEDAFRIGQEAAQDQADAVEESAERTREAAEAAREARSAMAEFATAVKSVDFQQAALQGGVAGMRQFTEELNALPTIASDTEAAFAALNAAVEENGYTFATTTEKGRANQDALAGVAEALDTKLAAAYDNANGSQEAFAAEAQTITDDTLARLSSEMGLSAEQTADLAARLGLLPEDIATRYELAGAAEAALKLEQLSGLLGSLPPDVQSQVAVMIAQGDLEGAVSLINSTFGAMAATVGVTADPSEAEGVIAGVEGGAYSATVDTGADTGEAESGIKGVTGGYYVAEVFAAAKTTTAQADLARLTNQDRTARIDVKTGSVDLPTANELANRIGTVRVPVDAYVRTTVDPGRLVGGRP